jgi:hypothetical protein
MTTRVLPRLAQFPIYRFKQPHFCILAAQCVRGLPVPREPREGMERWEAPGHQWAPLRRGVNPPRAARHRARPRLGAAPPSAPPATRPSTVPGRPGPASFRSARRRIASRKRSLIGQDTSRISEVLGTGISIPQDSKNLMLMNENLPSSRRMPGSITADVCVVRISILGDTIAQTDRSQAMSPTFAGTTTHTAILRCRTGAPTVSPSAASMMALASMP